MEKGTQPSELAEIGCPYCAYCFDEALLLRERATAVRAEEEARAEFERERDFDRKRQEIARPAGALPVMP